MNGPQDYARWAANVLRGRPAEPRAQAGVRDRGISSIASAMVERRRRRATRRALGACAALAIATAALAPLLPTRAREEAPARGGAPVASAGFVRAGVSGGRSCPPGSRISASSAPLSVRFGAITRLDLEPHSELDYTSRDATRRFRLLHGSVRLRVEKLAAGERFIVETPDAEIEVRGTFFEVSLAQPSNGASCASLTRVRTFEGAVEVRSVETQQVLAAGQDWSSTCSETPAQAASSTPGRPGSSAVPKTAARGNSHAANAHAMPADAPARREPTADRASVEQPPAGSALAAQNDLYAAAVAAKRGGSAEEAARLFGQLITRYPGGPLEESATIERLRVLLTTNRARAEAEARRYLARFPRGFARKEAESVLRP